VRQGAKNIIAPPPIKTVEFEVKNRRKLSAEKAKAKHLLLLLLFFFDSNETRLALETHLTKL